MLLCTVVVRPSLVIFVWSYKVIFSEKKVILSSFLGHKKWPSSYYTRFLLGENDSLFERDSYCRAKFVYCSVKNHYYFT